MGLGISVKIDLQNQSYIFLEMPTPMGESICLMVRLDVKVDWLALATPTANNKLFILAVLPSYALFGLVPIDNV